MDDLSLLYQARMGYLINAPYVRVDREILTTLMERWYETTNTLKLFNKNNNLDHTSDLKLKMVLQLKGRMHSLMDAHSSQNTIILHLIIDNTLQHQNLETRSKYILQVVGDLECSFHIPL